MARGRLVVAMLLFAGAMVAEADSAVECANRSPAEFQCPESGLWAANTCTGTGADACNDCPGSPVEPSEAGECLQPTPYYY